MIFSPYSAYSQLSSDWWKDDKISKTLGLVDLLSVLSSVLLDSTLGKSLSFVWAYEVWTAFSPYITFPLWLLLRQYISNFVEITMSYVILGNNRICSLFLTKKDQKSLWCQIDFLIICNFFWSNHLMIWCQTKVQL